MSPSKEYYEKVCNGDYNNQCALWEEACFSRNISFCNITNNKGVTYAGIIEMKGVGRGNIIIPLESDKSFLKKTIEKNTLWETIGKDKEGLSDEVGVSNGGETNNFFVSVRGIKRIFGVNFERNEKITKITDNLGGVVMDAEFRKKSIIGLIEVFKREFPGWNVEPVDKRLRT